MRYNKSIQKVFKKMETYLIVLVSWILQIITFLPRLCHQTLRGLNCNLIPVQRLNRPLDPQFLLTPDPYAQTWGQWILLQRYRHKLSDKLNRLRLLVFGKTYQTVIRLLLNQLSFRKVCSSINILIFNMEYPQE